LICRYQNYKVKNKIKTHLHSPQPACGLWGLAMYKIKIQKFQGPLDLLLQLIEQQKLEITEVSIGEVTDQYIEHMEGLIDYDPDELSDFLVLAARLLLLKSKAILPILEEEEELDDLEKQLKIYKEFLEAAKRLDKMMKKTTFTYSRTKPPFEVKVEFSPAPNMKPKDLHSAFLTVLKRLDPIVRLPRQMIERTISMQQKMVFLKDYLKRKKQLGFNDLFKEAESKTEVIINFLAVLELVKQKYLAVKQDKLFEDIVIEKI
jgi:segregation and condensation protein A